MQARREVATDHRSEPAERLHPEVPIQNGDASIDQTRPQGERLVYVHRPQGCVLPYPNIPCVQAVPQIRVGAENVPVQGTLLRPKHITIRVYESLSTGIDARSPARTQALPLPGRLAVSDAVATRGSSNAIHPGGQLGLIVNLDKSELEPTQNTVFLGMQIDTVEFTVRPSEHRLSRLDASLRCILREEAPTAKTYL